MQSFKKCPSNKINEIIKAYKSFLIQSKNPYISYCFQLPKCTISIYSNNTVTFLGDDEQQIASKWFINEDTVQQSPQSKYSIHQFPLIGSDESGSGDVFGPLVVSAALIQTHEQFQQLTNLNITDSKKLSNAENIKLAKLIKEICHTITVVFPPLRYNTLHNRGINLNALKTAGHFQATQKLSQIVATSIMVDQFTPASSFWKYVTTTLNKQWPTNINNYHFETKAESKYLAVAAASIVARSEYLIQITKLNSEFGIEIPLGAGANVDKFINQIDETILPQIAKMHFKNIKLRQK